MILLIFLCLKLTIIHFSTSDLGYQCSDFRWYTNSKPTIFLISDYGNDYNERLQLNFECNCWQFYDIQFGSLEEAYKYDNVIQFAVLDYNDGKLPMNFEYAGNITKTQKVVCNKTGEPGPEFDCREIANLVSSPLLTLNDGHVYSYVQKMEIINKTDNDCLNSEDEPLKCKPFVHARPIDLTTVVICRPELRNPKEAKIYVYAPKRTPLTVVQVSCDYHNLDSYNDQILAMLAPKPFEISTEYLVPTIFYKTPYIFPENLSAFPNSMNVVPWRLLKYGFLKFIQTVGWRRVAVVTDDSEYSLEFENELTALFYKERIVFTVIRCEDMNCEMNKIKQKLDRASIVVANVEAKHAKYLVKNANNANTRITWIVRDMAGNTVEFRNRHVFFISLRAVHHTEDCGDVMDDNILNGLSTVALAYKELGKADFELKKREFYRRFANKAKEITTRKTEAIAVVYSGNGAEISTMYVNGTGAQLLSFKDPFGSRKPSDGTSHCLATSYDYFKPCEDHIVLFFISVLLVFVITFLLVLCYFEKTSPLIDVRYRNL